MKKKITIALSILFMIIIVGVIAISAYRSSESYRANKVSEPTSERMEICIDNIYYVNTGIEMPIEPDESTVEFVEIPVGSGSTIKAFARIQDGNEDYLVCRIGEEWYKFIEE